MKLVPHFIKVLFVFHLFVKWNFAFEGCGYPGLSNGSKIVNSNLNWDNDFYNKIGDIVEYDCVNNEKYRLRGNRQRICQADGTWSGILPWCAENIAFSKQYEVLLHNGSSIPLDNFTDKKCFLLHAGPKIWIDVIFKKEYFFEEVHIYGSKDHQIYPIQGDGLVVKSQDREIYRCQKIFNIHTSYHHQYDCNNSATNASALQFWHTSSKPILICGIKVFIRKDKMECNYPEKPTHSQVTLVSTFKSLSAKYQCTDEFELTGSAQRECMGTHWSGEQPVCRRMDPEKMKAIELEKMTLLIQKKTSYSWTAAIIILTVLFVVAIVIIITRRYWWNPLATKFRQVYKLFLPSEDAAQKDTEPSPSSALFIDDHPNEDNPVPHNSSVA